MRYASKTDIVATYAKIRSFLKARYQWQNRAKIVLADAREGVYLAFTIHRPNRLGLTIGRTYRLLYRSDRKYVLVAV